MSDIIEQARAELRKSDEGKGSEPWAVRELLAEVERLEAERDGWKALYEDAIQSWAEDIKRLAARATGHSPR